MQRLPNPSSAFMAFLAFRAFVAQQLESWVFVSIGGEKVCEECDSHDGEVFEVESDDELLDLFEYGEFVDADTFKPNVHPNCRCYMKRLEVEAPEEVPFAEFWLLIEKGV